jgi:hypothetical protein
VQIAAQTIDSIHGTAGHAWPIDKKPPKPNLGGKRRAVFRGYTGSRPLGSPLDASRRMTLVFRAAAAHRSIPSPAGPEKDDDA